MGAGYNLQEAWFDCTPNLVGLCKLSIGIRPELTICIVSENNNHGISDFLTVEG